MGESVCLSCKYQHVCGGYNEKPDYLKCDGTSVPVPEFISWRLKMAEGQPKTERRKVIESGRY